MRIIGGAWRGRKLLAPPGTATRPTADRVRQTLFDILLHTLAAGRNSLDGVRVLDAFAGTGATGLEALSRGAASATFMERDPAALRALRANITACRAEPRAAVLVVDVLAAPAGAPCDLVFLDPPYGQGLPEQAMTRLQATGWIAPDAVVVVENGRDEAPPALGALVARRTHGAAMLSFFRVTGGTVTAL